MFRKVVFVQSGVFYRSVIFASIEFKLLFSPKYIGLLHAVFVSGRFATFQMSLLAGLTAIFQSDRPVKKKHASISDQSKTERVEQ